MLRCSVVVAAPVLLALALPACPAPSGEGEGEGEAGEGEGEGEGEEGEGEEGEGEEGEGEEGEGEGEGGEGEGEGEGEGAACGDDVVDTAGIVGTEGVVIARDGTIYFSQSQAIGRRTPDGVVDDNWAALPGARTVWGVMLSPDNQTVYAASPTTQSVFVVDVATAAVRFELEEFQAPNGLTVDDDGTLFVADFGGNIVVGITVGADAASSPRFRVSEDIEVPNGVVVDGDDVLVLDYNSGELFRVVGGRTATGAAQRVALGLGNPDGIVKTDDGGFFVTDNGGGALLRVTSAGVVSTVRGGIDGAANLEFGTAPLRCDQLFVTSFDALAVVDVDVAAAPVPWR